MNNSQKSCMNCKYWGFTKLNLGCNNKKMCIDESLWRMRK